MHIDIPLVLESTRYVVDRARSVSIDLAAVERWAAEQRVESLALPVERSALQFDGTREEIANFCLLQDCLNFCFWSDPLWRTEYRGRTYERFAGFLAALLRGVAESRDLLRARTWADIELSDVEHLFRGQNTLPLLLERTAILNETGRVLCERYDGQFAAAAESAGFDAIRLAYLLADEFPSFRDVAEYDGRAVAILKRAQLCAADLAWNWSRNGLGELSRMESLTAFADYRLPQLLRHLQILRLDDGFAGRIDNLQHIEAGAKEEIELRACTIWAIEEMCRALARRDIDIPAWQIDYVLWERSHDAEITIPHHRTLTVYY